MDIICGDYIWWIADAFVIPGLASCGDWGSDRPPLLLASKTGLWES